ncbi:MAG: hypothetical protein ACLUHE_04890 [Christensenellales bacterium]
MWPYAHMKASNIPPWSAFSNSAYDFSATISSRDTFAETRRQLAARKARHVTADDVTEIDLGFDLSYLPQPATPWLLEMLPYIIMTVGLMAFLDDDDAPAGRRRWQDDDLRPQPGARV